MVQIPPEASDPSSAALQVVLALRVSYNGAPFSGFARQPGQLTVQGNIEEALAMIFRHPIETTCAGRTDSGVHARGQVVSFSLSTDEWIERSEYKFLRSINALTHEDIAIRDLARKPLDFSARFSARLREYRYFICTDRSAPLLMKNFSWHLAKPLDVPAMREAAAHLIGEHDFRSFCMAASAEGKSTFRHVSQITVEEEELWGENLVVITVKGNAFLHSMVRTIVGTLVAVGLGNREPSWVFDVLAACDRSAAGENAPAAGLVFWQVDYEGERLYDPERKRGEAETEHASRASRSHRREARSHKEFVIPRGDGAAPVSGAFLSDVKEDPDAFDLERDYSALKDPDALSSQPMLLDRIDVFGEVILDEPSEVEEGALSRDIARKRYPFQMKAGPVESAEESSDQSCDSAVIPPDPDCA